jgi:hypothetical protein
MQRKNMELAIFWLPIVGGILLGGVAVGAWYAGNKIFGLWVGFAGLICFLFVAALQVQQAITKHPISNANDAAVKQSRAYVFVDTIRTSNIDDDLLSISPTKIASIMLVIKNTGQTPAFKMSHRASIRFAPFPPPPDLFNIPAIPPRTVDTLPPGGMAQNIVGLGRALNVDEKTILGLGTHAVYLFGEIGYEDTFGFKRCTKYRYRVGGDVGFNGTAMAPMAEGNEADNNCTN